MSKAPTNGRAASATPESVPSLEVPVGSIFRHEDTATSSDCDDDDSLSESDFGEDNEFRGVSLEEAVASILGPGFAHYAQVAIDSFPSPSLEQLSDGATRTTNGSDSTLASSNSQPTDTASSPNTQTTVTSGGKRKSAGGGGDQDEEADDNGNDRPPKKPKKTASPSGRLPKQRWDCPIERRAIRAGQIAQPSKSRGCAPGGLEFRNVWYFPSHLTLLMKLIPL